MKPKAALEHLEWTRVFRSKIITLIPKLALLASTQSSRPCFIATLDGEGEGAGAGEKREEEGAPGYPVLSCPRPVSPSIASVIETLRFIDPLQQSPVGIWERNYRALKAKDLISSLPIKPLICSYLFA